MFSVLYAIPLYSPVIPVNPSENDAIKTEIPEPRSAAEEGANHINSLLFENHDFCKPVN
jgi:hypothetical protein